MIHLLMLAVHLLATIAKLLRPGAVVAESLLLKHPLVTSSRARRRAPNLKHARRGRSRVAPISLRGTSGFNTERHFFSSSIALSTAAIRVHRVEDAAA